MISQAHTDSDSWITVEAVEKVAKLDRASHMHEINNSHHHSQCPDLAKCIGNLHFSLWPGLADMLEGDYLHILQPHWIIRCHNSRSWLLISRVKCYHSPQCTPVAFLMAVIALCTLPIPGIENNGDCYLQVCCPIQLGYFICRFYHNPLITISLSYYL